MEVTGKERIDIVIPWVDGKDPVWQRQKAEYQEEKPGNENCRFRDWDNLQYVLRSIETNADWVGKVHLITWGHLPAWLNVSASRLHIVRHEEYLPKEYRPTFSSHVIELNLHRIKELSETFIYFNDDTFLLRPLRQEDFFQGGLPVDSAIQTILPMNTGGEFEHIVLNDLQILNRNFDKRNCVAKHRNKWFHPIYGRKNGKNFYLQPVSCFTGFEDLHIPYAYRKSILREVWEKEEGVLDATCRRKFRSGKDVNQYLFRYWQLASGQFVPGDPNRGRKFEIGAEDTEIRDALLKKRYRMVCLNDSLVGEGFEKERTFINGLLSQLFPKKSSFEL